MCIRDRCYSVTVKHVIWWRVNNVFLGLRLFVKPKIPVCIFVSIPAFCCTWLNTFRLSAATLCYTTGLRRFLHCMAYTHIYYFFISGKKLTSLLEEVIPVLDIWTWTSAQDLNARNRERIDFRYQNRLKNNSSAWTVNDKSRCNGMTLLSTQLIHFLLRDRFSDQKTHFCVWLFILQNICMPPDADGAHCEIIITSRLLKSLSNVHNCV